MDDIPVLIPVMNGLLKEKFQRLMAIKAKLCHNKAKINEQNFEKDKTLYYLDILHKCLKQQDNVLDYYNAQSYDLAIEEQRLDEDINKLNDDSENSIPSKAEISDFLLAAKTFSVSNTESVLRTTGPQTETTASIEVGLKCIPGNQPDTVEIGNRNKEGGFTTVEPHNCRTSPSPPLKRKSETDSGFVACPNKRHKNRSIPLVSNEMSDRNNIKVLTQSSSLKLLTAVSVETTVRGLLSKTGRLYMCGSHGHLSQFASGQWSHYPGHEDREVLQLYVYNDSVISVTSHTVNIHKIKDPENRKELCRFPTAIAANCFQKSSIFVALLSGDLYVVDLSKEDIGHTPAFFLETPSAIAVVKYCNKIYMVAALSKSGEVISIDMNNKERVLFKSLGHTDGKVHQIVFDSTSLVCCTDYTLYLIEKHTWRMLQLRRISNRIMCADLNANLLVFVDSARFLHRYMLRRSRIHSGSTVEFLGLERDFHCVHLPSPPKKLLLAAGSDVYSLKI